MPSQPSNSKLKHKLVFEAIGTRWSVETVRDIGSLKARITRRIEAFDKTYSRFRPDSLVTQVAQTAGTYEFPEDAATLIDFYRRLYETTEGAVSPLVGGVLASAGYDSDYSLQPKEVKAALHWDDVMQWRGTTLRTVRPVLLDFGAAGKGYVVDIVAGLMEQEGHETYVIDASGDVMVRGSSEVVGLENPYDPTRVLGAVRVENASLCASATTRRAWGEWHHVVDPRTAKPVTTIVASWVIAQTTLLADGLATALFFVDGAQLGDWDFQYVRLLSNGTVERSPDFVGELYEQ